MTDLPDPDRDNRLLRTGVDPDPVWVREGKGPVLLVCEHAGRAIPQRLDGLGLSSAERKLHIAYDIGSEAVAEQLSQRLDCPLIRQRYSRLVIDCNRPPGTAQSIPEISDGVRIPGNTGLSTQDRAQREAEIFAPLTAACRDGIARPGIRFTYAIHSFTPEMGGQARPWDVGFLYRAPGSQGDRLTALARAMWPDLTIGQNKPYQIEDETDWFIPACAEPRGIPHALIEIRNDHLLTEAGCASWAARLSDLISAFMEQSDDPDP